MLGTEKEQCAKHFRHNAFKKLIFFRAEEEENQRRCVVLVRTRGVVTRASRKGGKGRSKERLSNLDQWSRKAMLKSEHLTRDLYEGGSGGGCYVNTGDHQDRGEEAPR